MIWQKRQWKLMDKILIALVVALGVFVIFELCWPGQTVWKNVQENITGTPEEKFAYFSALDGAGVSGVVEQYPAVVGAMIDNHPDAYPQTGLADARVVYEALAEGVTTRFLAIFDRGQTVAKVGPVRSVRPYYLEWLREYGDGLYMHCGGSPEALSLIKQENIFDANEFWWGKFYWRTNTEIAPHNLFTSSERWQNLLAQYGSERPSTTAWQGWKFDANFSATGTPTKVIAIKMPGPEIGWQYNFNIKKWERLQGGRPHLDSGGAIISADNVMVQFVSTKIVDEVGRREMAIVGHGEARVLRDGVMVRGQWKKEKSGERTRFYDSFGGEISLKPGQTWVEVVPENTVIELTN